MNQLAVFLVLAASCEILLFNQPFESQIDSYCSNEFSMS
ncbi:hypothetical protein KC19_6G172500 [Ceratodon purpureus]|uniref:Uncharacterized protein n=1 Tax=Ceratodon purpureus TaxID=3225 RepID=A0A8T0HJ09_CERPU|nr:hypothetical protein KC19_6G172500 [Ceratodon purpureus]